VSIHNRFLIIREALCEKHGLKIEKGQRDFARHLGTTGSTISNIEKGKTMVSGDVLVMLKQAYPESNLNWLFDGEGDMFLDYSKHPMHFQQLLKEKDEQITLLKDMVEILKKSK
jgi:transcriptional regulator with XRE-family HTH domain